MTSTEKKQKQEDLKNEARDLQLRFGFLKMQLDDIEEELKSLRILMHAGDRKFQVLKDAPVEPDAAT